MGRRCNNPSLTVCEFKRLASMETKGLKSRQNVGNLDGKSEKVPTGK